MNTKRKLFLLKFSEFVLIICSFFANCWGYIPFNETETAMQRIFSFQNFLGNLNENFLKEGNFGKTVEDIFEDWNGEFTDEDIFKEKVNDLININNIDLKETENLSSILELYEGVIERNIESLAKNTTFDNLTQVIEMANNYKTQLETLLSDSNINEPIRNFLNTIKIYWCRLIRKLSKAENYLECSECSEKLNRIKKIVEGFARMANKIEENVAAEKNKPLNTPGLKTLENIKGDISNSSLNTDLSQYLQKNQINFIEIAIDKIIPYINSVSKSIYDFALYMSVPNNGWNTVDIPQNLIELLDEFKEKIEDVYEHHGLRTYYSVNLEPAISKLSGALDFLDDRWNSFQFKSSTEIRNYTENAQNFFISTKSFYDNLTFTSFDDWQENFFSELQRLNYSIQYAESAATSFINDACNIYKSIFQRVSEFLLENTEFKNLNALIEKVDSYKNLPEGLPESAIFLSYFDYLIAKIEEKKNYFECSHCESAIEEIEKKIDILENFDELISETIARDLNKPLHDLLMNPSFNQGFNSFYNLYMLDISSLLEDLSDSSLDVPVSSNEINFMPQIINDPRNIAEIFTKKMIPYIKNITGNIYNFTFKTTAPEEWEAKTVPTNIINFLNILKNIINNLFKYHKLNTFYTVDLDLPIEELNKALNVLQEKWNSFQDNEDIRKYIELFNFAKNFFDSLEFSSANLPFFSRFSSRSLIDEFEDWQNEFLEKIGNINNTPESLDIKVILEEVCKLYETINYLTAHILEIETSFEDIAKVKNMAVMAKIKNIAANQEGIVLYDNIKFCWDELINKLNEKEGSCCKEEVEDLYKIVKNLEGINEKVAAAIPAKPEALDLVNNAKQISKIKGALPLAVLPSFTKCEANNSLSALVKITEALNSITTTDISELPNEKKRCEFYSAFLSRIPGILYKIGENLFGICNARNLKKDNLEDEEVEALESIVNDVLIVANVLTQSNTCPTCCLFEQVQIIMECKKALKGLWEKALNLKDRIVPSSCQSGKREVEILHKITGITKKVSEQIREESFFSESILSDEFFKKNSIFWKNFEKFKDYIENHQNFDDILNILTELEEKWNVPPYETLLKESELPRCYEYFETYNSFRESLGSLNNVLALSLAKISDVDSEVHYNVETQRFFGEMKEFFEGLAKLNYVKDPCRLYDVKRDLGLIFKGLSEQAAEFTKITVNCYEEKASSFFTNVLQPLEIILKNLEVIKNSAIEYKIEGEIDLSSFPDLSDLSNCMSNISNLIIDVAEIYGTECSDSTMQSVSINSPELFSIYLTRYKTLLERINQTLNNIVDLFNVNYEALITKEYRDSIMRVAESLLNSNIIEKLYASLKCSICNYTAFINTNSLDNKIYTSEIKKLEKALVDTVEKISDALYEKYCGNEAMATYKVFKTLIEIESLLEQTSSEEIIALLNNYKSNTLYTDIFQIKESIEDIIFSSHGRISDIIIAEEDLAVFKLNNELIKIRENLQNFLGKDPIPFKNVTPRYNTDRKLDYMYLINDCLNSMTSQFAKYTNEILYWKKNSITEDGFIYEYNPQIIDTFLTFGDLIEVIAEKLNSFDETCQECDVRGSTLARQKIAESCLYMKQSIADLVDVFLDDTCCEKAANILFNIVREVSITSAHLKKISQLNNIDINTLSTNLGSIRTALQSVVIQLTNSAIQFDNVTSTILNDISAINTQLRNISNVDIWNNGNLPQISEHEALNFVIISLSFKFDDINKSLCGIAKSLNNKIAAAYDWRIYRNLFCITSLINNIKQNLIEFLNFCHFSNHSTYFAPVASTKQILETSIKPNVMNDLALIYRARKFYEKQEYIYNLMNATEKMRTVLEVCSNLLPEVTLQNGEEVNITNTKNIKLLFSDWILNIKNFITLINTPSEDIDEEEEVNIVDINNLNKISDGLIHYLEQNNIITEPFNLTFPNFTFIKPEQSITYVQKIFENMDEIVDQIKYLWKKYADQPFTSIPIVTEAVNATKYLAEYVISLINKSEFSTRYELKVNVDKTLNSLETLIQEVPQALEIIRLSHCGNVSEPDIGSIFLNLYNSIRLLPKLDDSFDSENQEDICPILNELSGLIESSAQKIEEFNSAVKVCNNIPSYYDRSICFEQYSSIKEKIESISNSIFLYKRKIKNIKEYFGEKYFNNNFFPLGIDSQYPHEKKSFYFVKILQLSKFLTQYFEKIKEFSQLDENICQRYSLGMVNSFSTLQSVMLSLKDAISSFIAGPSICFSEDSFNKYVLREINGEIDKIKGIIDTIKENFKKRIWSELIFSFKKYLNTIEVRSLSLEQVNKALKKSIHNDSILRESQYDETVIEYNNIPIKELLESIKEEMLQYTEDLEELNNTQSSTDYITVLPEYAHFFNEFDKDWKVKLETVANSMAFGTTAEQPADDTLKYGFDSLYAHIEKFFNIIKNDRIIIGKILKKLINTEERIVKSEIIEKFFKQIKETLVSFYNEIVNSFEKINDIAVLYWQTEGQWNFSWNVNNGIWPSSDSHEILNSIKSEINTISKYLEDIEKLFSIKRCCKPLVIASIDLSAAISNIATKLWKIQQEPNETIDINEVFRNILENFNRTSVREHWDRFVDIYTHYENDVPDSAPSEEDNIDANSKCYSKELRNVINSFANILNKIAESIDNGITTGSPFTQENEVEESSNLGRASHYEATTQESEEAAEETRLLAWLERLSAARQNQPHPEDEEIVGYNIEHENIIYCHLLPYTSKDMIDSVNDFNYEIKHLTDFIINKGLNFRLLSETQQNALSDIFEILCDVTEVLPDFVVDNHRFADFCPQCQANRNRYDYSDFFQEIFSSLKEVKISFGHFKDILCRFCDDPKDGNSLQKICNGLAGCRQYLNGFAIENLFDQSEKLVKIEKFLEKLKEPLGSMLQKTRHQKAMELGEIAKIFEDFDFSSNEFIEIKPYYNNIPDLYIDRIIEQIMLFEENIQGAAKAFNKKFAQSPQIFKIEQLIRIREIIVFLEKIAAFFENIPSENSILHDFEKSEKTAYEIKTTIWRIIQAFWEIYSTMSPSSAYKSVEGIFLSSLQTVETAIHNIEYALSTLPEFIKNDVNFGEYAEEIENKLLEIKNNILVMDSIPNIQAAIEQFFENGEITSFYTLREAIQNLFLQILEIQIPIESSEEEPPVRAEEFSVTKGMFTVEEVKPEWKLGEINDSSDDSWQVIYIEKGLSKCVDSLLGIVKKDPKYFDFEFTPENTAVLLSRISRYIKESITDLENFAETLYLMPAVRYHESLIKVISLFQEPLNILNMQIIDLAQDIQKAPISSSYECCFILKTCADDIKELAFKIVKIVDILNKKEKSYETKFQCEIAARLECLAEYMHNIDRLDQSTLSEAKEFFSKLLKLLGKLKENSLSIKQQEFQHTQIMDDYRIEHIKIFDEIIRTAEDIFNGEAVLVKSSSFLFDDSAAESIDMRIKGAISSIASAFSTWFEDWILPDYKLDLDFFLINREILKGLKEKYLLYNVDEIRDVLRIFIEKQIVPTCCKVIAEHAKQIDAYMRIIGQLLEEIAYNPREILGEDKYGKIDEISEILSGITEKFTENNILDCLKEDFQDSIGDLKEKISDISIALGEGLEIALEVEERPLQEGMLDCLKKDVLINRFFQNCCKVTNAIAAIADNIVPKINVLVEYEPELINKIQILKTELHKLVLAFPKFIEKDTKCETCNAISRKYLLTCSMSKLSLTESYLKKIEETLENAKYSKISEKIHNILQNKLNIQKILRNFDFSQIADSEYIVDVITEMGNVWNEFISGNIDLFGFLTKFETNQQQIIEALDSNIPTIEIPNITFGLAQIELETKILQQCKEQNDVILAELFKKALEKRVANDYAATIFNRVYHTYRWIYDDKDLLFENLSEEYQLRLIGSLIPSEICVDELRKIKNVYTHSTPCQRYIDELNNIVNDYQDFTNLISNIVSLNSLPSPRTKEDAIVVSKYISKIAAAIKKIKKEGEEIIRSLSVSTYDVCFTENYFTEKFFLNIKNIGQNIKIIKKKLTQIKRVICADSTEQGLSLENLGVQIDTCDIDCFEEILSAWKILQEVEGSLRINFYNILFLLKHQAAASCLFDQTVPSFTNTFINFFENILKNIDASEEGIFKYERKMYTYLTRTIKEITERVPYIADLKKLLFRNSIINNSIICIKEVKENVENIRDCISELHVEDKHDLFLNLKKIKDNITEIVNSIFEYKNTPFLTFNNQNTYSYTVADFANSLTEFQTTVDSMFANLNEWVSIIQAENGLKDNERCFDQELVDDLTTIIEACMCIEALYEQDWNWFCTSSHFTSLKESFVKGAAIVTEIRDLIMDPTCCIRANQCFGLILPALEKLKYSIIGAQNNFNLQDLNDSKIKQIIQLINQASENLLWVIEEINNINPEEEQHCNITNLIQQIRNTCSCLNFAIEPLANVFAILGPKDAYIPLTLQETHSCKKIAEYIKLTDQELYSVCLNFASFVQKIKTSDDYEYNANLSAALKILLLNFIEACKSIEIFFYSKANNICQGCNMLAEESGIEFTNTLEALGAIQNGIFEIIKQIETNNLNKKSKIFHSIVDYIDLFTQQIKVFLSLDASNSEQLTISLFADFVDKISNLYEKISKNLQKILISPILENFDFFAQMLKEETEQLNQQLLSLGSQSLQITSVLGYTYDEQLLENDTKRLNDIVRELSTTFQIAERPGIYNHVAIITNWKESINSFAPIIEILSYYSENEDLNGALSSYNHFIEFLEKMPSESILLEHFFEIDELIRKINRAINYKKYSLINNLNIEEHEQFLDIVQSLAENLNYIAEKISLPEIKNGLEEVYSEILNLLNVFSLETYSDSAQSQFTPQADVLMRRIEQDIAILCDLTREMVEISDLCPVRDYHEAALEGLDILSISISNCLEMLKLNYNPNTLERNIYYQNVLQNISEIIENISEEKEVLKKTCCSRFVYQLFEMADKISILNQLIENCPEIIELISGEDNKNLINTAENINLTLFNPENWKEILQELIEVFTSTTDSPFGDYFVADSSNRLFSKSISSTEDAFGVMHPVLYRCDGLPMVISEGFAQLNLLNDILSEQLEILKNEKILYENTRPLYVLTTKLIESINSLKQLAQTKNIEVGHVCLYCQEYSEEIIAALDQEEIFDTTIARLQELQIILKKYDYFGTAEELDYYNYNIVKIVKILKVLTEHLEENWEYLQLLPVDDLLSLLTKEDEVTPGILQILQQIGQEMDSQIEQKELNMDNLEALIAVIRERAGELAEILQDSILDEVEIPPYEALTKDEISPEKMIEILLETVANHKALSDSLSALQKKISEENLVASPELLAGFEKIADILEEFMDAVSDISTKFDDDFIAEELPDDQIIKNVLSEIIESYKTLSEILKAIKASADKDYGSSSLKLLSEIANQTKVLQLFLAQIFEAGAENNPDLIINIVNTLGEELSNIKTNIDNINTQREIVRASNDVYKLNGMEASLEELLESVKNIIDKTTEISSNAGLTMPTLPQVEQEDYSADDLPWLIIKIASAVNDLANTLSDVAGNIEVPAGSYELEAFDLLRKICLEIEKSVNDLLVSEDITTLSQLYSKDQVNEALTEVAEAFIALSNSLRKVKNSINEKFCCTEMYLKLEETAQILSALNTIVSRVNIFDIPLSEFSICSIFSEIAAIGDAIEDVNKIFIKLLSKRFALLNASEEMYCQSKELIPYIELLNKDLSEKLYLAVCQLARKFEISPYKVDVRALKHLVRQQGEELYGFFEKPIYPLNIEINSYETFENLLSSVNSTFQNINNTLRKFSDNVTEKTLESLPDIRLVNSLKHLISALYNTSENTAIFFNDFIAKQICLTRIELVPNLAIENFFTADILQGILEFLLQYKNPEKVQIINEISINFEKFVNIVEKLNTLSDSKKLLSDDISIGDLLKKWCQESSAMYNSILEIYDLTKKGNLDQFEEYSLLLYLENINSAMSTLLRETIYFAEAKGIQLSSYVPTDDFMISDISFADAAQKIEIQSRILEENLIWLGNDIAFAGPINLNDTLTQIKVFKDQLAKIEELLKQFNIPDFEPLINAVNNIASGIGKIGYMLEDPNRIAILNFVNNVDQNVQLLAKNITQIKEIGSNIDEEKYKENFEKFLKNIEDLKVFAVLPQNFDENIPFAEMLTSMQNICIALGISPINNINYQEAPSLQAALMQVSLSVVQLTKSLINFCPVILQIHRRIGFKIGNFNIPLAMCEIMQNLEKKSEKIEFLYDSVKNLTEVFTFLTKMIAIGFREFEVTELLEELNKLIITEEGENIFSLLYKPKYNEFGIPIIDKKGKVVVEKGTFAQKSEVTSNFAILLNNSLFMTP